LRSRKRNRSSIKSANTHSRSKSFSSAKKQKFNGQLQHDQFKHSPSMSFSQAQLASFHEQIQTLKRTHGLTPPPQQPSDNNSTQCKRDHDTKADHQHLPPPSRLALEKQTKHGNNNTTNKNSQNSTAQLTKKDEHHHTDDTNKQHHTATTTNVPIANTNIEQRSDSPPDTAPQQHQHDKLNDFLEEIDDDENMRSDSCSSTHNSVECVTDVVDNNSEHSHDKHDWDSFMACAFDKDGTDDGGKSDPLRATTTTSMDQTHQTHPTPRNAAAAEEERQEGEGGAVATDSDWHGFLSTRYDTDDVRKSDWKPPEINTFWEQGPIGQVMSWWNDEQFATFVDKCDAAASKAQEQATASAAEVSKRKQLRIIKRDVMKELKQQKLQKSLEARIEGGEVVKNMDTANNPFESFFTAALELGDDIRSGNVDVEQLLQEGQKQKKTRLIQPKLKKLKQIASLADDDLFFFDDDDDDDDDSDKEGEENDGANDDNDDGEFLHRIDSNDLIHINENSIAHVGDAKLSAGKVRSEQVLLQQRVQSQRAEMHMAQVQAVDDAGQSAMEEVRDNGGTGSSNSNAVLPANVLTNTVEDATQEKKILKKLNVMDYVHRYKDPFYREVEELNLNLDALLQNWSIIKRNATLGRKLKKKLGIMMARQRVQKRKQQKAEGTGIKRDNDSDIDMFLDVQ